MAELRADLMGVHNYIGVIFDYHYERCRASAPNGGSINDSFLDNIRRNVNYALDTAIWLRKHTQELAVYKVNVVLDGWKETAEKMRRDNNAINYLVIPQIKKEVQEVFYTL